MKNITKIVELCDDNMTTLTTIAMTMLPTLDRYKDYRSTVGV